MLTPFFEEKIKDALFLADINKRCITRLKSFCSILIRVPT